MCGIFGSFTRTDRLPSPQQAAAALARIAHRGPDAQGLLFRPEYGLVFGHRRLSILDVDARSDQPFAAADSLMVYNGEIYNFRVLREELQRLGAVFRTTSDTEVVAVGYRHWGTAVFERLRGMFALALYDERERCLHLARDEFGIKPLCVLERDDGIVFASEVKAIAALHSLAIDGGVLCDLLRWGFPMGDGSLYAGVRHLPPGTLLTLRRDASGALRQSTREIWPARRAYLEPGKEPTAAELRAVVEASVSDHLIADVPVAMTLSGGLDSSIVTVAASHHAAGLHAHTFTLTQDTDPEVQHATLLCRHLGLEHRVARLLRGDVQGWLRRVAWHLEEPIANVNALPGFALAAMVRAEGFKVVLVGEGSDELFGGYPWYRLALDPQLQGDPGAMFDAYRRRRSQPTLERCLRPGTNLAGEQRLRRQRDEFITRQRQIAHSPLDGFLSFDLENQLQYSQLLRVDRTFMAHGVEARVPFLYRPVLQASAALPGPRKLLPADGPGRREKVALAEAFAECLPERIAARPKFGAAGTVDLWSTWLAESLSSAFTRCLHAPELRGAREMLDEFIDWSAVGSAALAPKDRFAVALLLEAVDAVLLARDPVDAGLPFALSVHDGSDVPEGM